MARLPDSEAFNLLDVVETDFSGRPTKHIVVARFKVRNSQTGVTYEVCPSVPKSSEGNRVGRLDHAWFRRIGNIALVNGKIVFQELKA